MLSWHGMSLRFATASNSSISERSLIVSESMIVSAHPSPCFVTRSSSGTPGVSTASVVSIAIATCGSAV